MTWVLGSVWTDSPTRFRRHQFIFSSGMLLATITAAVSCAPPATNLPPSPPVVAVSMREYGFDYDHAISRGRVTFRVRNMGRVGHQLALLRLPDDFTDTLDAQLHSPVRMPTERLGGLPTLDPGERGFFAADLAPGHYAVVCFLPDQQGTPHALKGMNSEFRVQ